MIQLEDSPRKVDYPISFNGILCRVENLEENINLKDIESKLKSK